MDKKGLSLMFHSRNPRYRNPVGAVEAGTSVHFRITVPRDQRCSAARLIVHRDAGGCDTLNMFWCGMNGEAYEWWECHYKPAEAGLYFYEFYIDTWHGCLRLGRGFGGEDLVDPKAPRWQMTVYEKGFTTPDWLAGGVMYQIFPDRFRASAQPKKNVPSDRVLRDDWEGEPVWRPNEKGEVTNSDYFGGDLRGIEEKLPYLKSLGVTCVYLNPIFEAHSNHRYNTADYANIDPLLGDTEDFRSLCRTAREFGIRILLDGVFSHTGSDSVYFNREGRYPEPGAFQSKDSPYYPWYTFQNWPEQYESWWGFTTLPNVRETNPEYNRYINGEGGIVRLWLDRGASGWRLDVADELPDEFLDNLRAAVKAEDPEAIVLGEVWEDVSTKSAYGQRRRYLLGRQLDSVMNYPFRDAILGFLTGADAASMMDRILSIVENYPPQVLRLLMNHIGTHDTERAITVLGGEPTGNRGREWQSTAHLSPEQRQRGLRLLRLAAVLQFTLPGVPCVYYGDEAGMEGYKDPFNRRCYPWGNENTELIEWYRRLGTMRAACSCLREGSIEPFQVSRHVLSYFRFAQDDALFCAVNRGDQPKMLYVPHEWRHARVLFGTGADEDGGVFLPPCGCAVLYRVLSEPEPEEEAPKAAKEPEPEEPDEPERELTASELASRGPVAIRKIKKIKK